MATRPALRSQPAIRFQDLVARSDSVKGAASQGALGLIWRVAGDAESDDDISLSSEEDDLSGEDSEPAEGHAQVAWLDPPYPGTGEKQPVDALDKGLDTASIGDLVCVDRQLALGVVVAAVDDPTGQTAIVTATHRLLDLKLSDGREIVKAPLSSVAPVVPFFPDQYVIKYGWLGRLEEVLESVTVRLADGSVAEFRCDQGIRPVKPVYSFDYLFREERTSPYWPGQKVTVETRVPAMWRMLSGKASSAKSGTVLSVVADTLVVDWLSCCTGLPGAEPPEVIPADSCATLQFLAKDVGFWHLGTRGLWKGDISVTATADPAKCSVIATGVSRTAAVPTEVNDQAREQVSGVAASSGSPTFAEVVKRSTVAADGHPLIKPSGRGGRAPMATGTPKSPASSHSTEKGATQPSSGATPGPAGWAASLASRILSYPTSSSPPAGWQRKGRRKNRPRKKKESLLQDADLPVTALVTRTYTTVDLEWQDGRKEEGKAATKFMPKIHLDDHEFWPGDLVEIVPDCLSTDWQDKLQRAGLVRSYDGQQRMAAVSWLPQTDTCDLLPASASTPVERLPVYVLRGHLDYSYSIGDVIIRLRAAQDYTEWKLVDNVGEVIGSKDGQLLVLFASGAEGYVLPDKIAILNRQDGDQTEESNADTSWSETSWSTCSEGNSTAEESPNVIGNTETDQWKHQGRTHLASSPQLILKFPSPREQPVPTAASASSHPDQTVPGAPLAASSPFRQASAAMQHTGQPSGSSPVLGSSPEGALGITFGSFGSAELDEICRAARPGMPQLQAEAGAWSLDNRFFRAIAGAWAPAAAGRKDHADTTAAPEADLHVGEPVLDIAFAHFDVIEEAPSDHLLLGKHAAAVSRNFQKAILKEWDLLREALPRSIWVRAYESRMDLMRIAILGAAGTPYARHLFLFDLQLPPDYPVSPPNVLYHSWGLRVNPNLYENGKVCLSLLGTWTGHKSEMWGPDSTLLQLVVSIQGLILVPRPYFNEAGYEKQAGSAAGEKNSVLYNEQAFLLTIRSAIHCMRRPPHGFEDLIKGHYKAQTPALVAECQAVLEGRSTVGSQLNTALSEEPLHAGQGEPSVGFCLILQQLQPKFKNALDQL